MTPEEELRRTHINTLVAAFVEELKALGVPTFAISVSFDDTPETGGGMTKVYGDGDTIAQMCCTVAAHLPTVLYVKMLTHLALNPEFAVQRGETAGPVDMAKVN